MVLQLGEYNDILKALHPSINFIFLFDHPCGHDRVRVDMLNVTNMNNGYGGTQKEMNLTYINHEVIYLGRHERILEVGDEKHVVLQEGGILPFWMNPQERVDTKFSQYYQTQLKDKTQAELLSNLKVVGVDISGVKGKRVGKPQDIYRKIYIFNKENK